MNLELLKKYRAANKKLANGKSSKESSLEQRVAIYRATVLNAATPEEQRERIHAFRCGW